MQIKKVPRPKDTATMGTICGPINRKDPASTVRVSKKMRMLLVILNPTSPKLFGDTLFRLDLFSIKMKRETTIIAAKKMRIVFMVIGINLHGFDRCYWAFR